MSRKSRGAARSRALQELEFQERQSRKRRAPSPDPVLPTPSVRQGRVEHRWVTRHPAPETRRRAEMAAANPGRGQELTFQKQLVDENGQVLSQTESITILPRIVKPHPTAHNPGPLDFVVVGPNKTNPTGPWFCFSLRRGRVEGGPKPWNGPRIAPPSGPRPGPAPRPRSS